jgi:hypothetical protein
MKKHLLPLAGVLLGTMLFLMACGNPPVSSLSLAVTTASLPATVVGQSYSQQLLASGGVGPYRWSVISGSLPVGLSLSTTGLLSGKPTTVGQFSFTVQVTDSATTAGAVAQIQMRGV